MKRFNPHFLDEQIDKLYDILIKQKEEYFSLIKKNKEKLQKINRGLREIKLMKRKKIIKKIFDILKNTN